MKRLILCALLVLNCASQELPAQGLSAPTLASPKPSPKKTAAKDPVKAAAGKKPEALKEAITTEIYAEQAFFDSAKSIGIFTGRVIVKDPRFNVQADKLTVYMTKGGTDETTDQQQQQQTLEKAVAEGNVGVVRDQPGEDGGPPQHSVGRGDTAIYTASNGNVELRGSPRVQNGLNTHIATSPDTVMVMTQSGQLTTTGPSRTEIHQEPKASPSPAGSSAPVASASPKP
jgi:lipopolysaccharide export system protein LptA